MKHIHIQSSEIMFIVVLVSAVLMLLLVYGRLFIQERFAPPANSDSSVTSADVARYFNIKGFEVLTVSAVPQTGEFIVCVNKDGNKEVITVFTKDNKIIKYVF